MALPHSAQSQQSVRWPRFIDELRRRLIAAGARRIYLFGSYARGEADDDSDVDVVVIKDTPLPFFERLREVSACLDPDWPVDLLESPKGGDKEP